MPHGKKSFFLLAVSSLIWLPVLAEASHAGKPSSPSSSAKKSGQSISPKHSSSSAHPAADTLISRTTKHPASPGDYTTGHSENKAHEGRTLHESFIRSSVTGNTVHRTYHNPDGSITNEVHRGE